MAMTKEEGILLLGEAKVGDWVDPDGWSLPGILEPGDGPVDSDYPGCQFRLRGRRESVPVNITITGGPRRRWASEWGWRRCKVEFIHDGYPSTFRSGWLLSTMGRRSPKNKMKGARG